MQWQYFHSPKARILETPGQAYLIIQGQSQYLQTQPRKRSGSSVTHECYCCLRKRQVSVREKDNLKDRQQQRQKRKNQREREVGRVTKTTQQSKPFSFRDFNKQTSNVNCNYPKTLQTENLALRKENQFLQSYISTLQSRMSLQITNKKQNRNNKKRTQGIQEYVHSQYQNPKTNFQQRQFDGAEGQGQGCPMISTRGCSDWNSYHA